MRITTAIAVQKLWLRGVKAAWRYYRQTGNTYFRLKPSSAFGSGFNYAMGRCSSWISETQPRK